MNAESEMNQGDGLGAAPTKPDPALERGEEAKAPHRFRVECPNRACHRGSFSLDVDPAGEVPCPTCGTPLRLA